MASSFGGDSCSLTSHNQFPNQWNLVRPWNPIARGVLGRVGLKPDLARPAVVQPSALKLGLIFKLAGPG